MRLATHRTADGFRLIASINQGPWVDVSRAAGIADLADVGALLALEDGLDVAARAAAQPGDAMVAAPSFGPPILRPGKVLAIGLNYREHARETGMEEPKNPIVFFKTADGVAGPDDAILAPTYTGGLDYEGELVVVIGKTARRVSREDALSYVLGYTGGNDVSLRAFQFLAPTWVMGKCYDTHTVIGPYLVTGDELGPPENQVVETLLNGERVQQGPVSDMIFSTEALIEFVSSGMTLHPGDLIFTGTPSGVGMSRKPPLWMKPGDTVEVRLSGIGALRNTVEADTR
jgi:2-keto-4-pentenoate hydratase/2-oxohepta-3-ene-1,7-dioic acid hydratase in catechol pathway